MQITGSVVPFLPEDSGLTEEADVLYIAYNSEESYYYETESSFKGESVRDALHKTTAHSVTRWSKQFLFRHQRVYFAMAIVSNVYAPC